MPMRRIAILGAIFLGLAGSAQARLVVGRGVFSAQNLVVAQATCPVGVPVQTFTVVNNAGIHPFALARFEAAIITQSLQVRTVWETPCVQFGSGGWYLYLEPNVTGYGAHFAPGGTDSGGFFPEAICVRRPDPSQACDQISVTEDWTENASHEIVETLVDPSGQGEEVCDPVERWAHRLKGVWVSDFVKPNGKPFYGR